MNTATIGTPLLNSPATMHSVESERMVLSVAINEERRILLNTLMGSLAADDFAIEQHGALWSSVRSLSDLGLAHDATAILDYTRSRNLFVGGGEYIASLVDDVLASTASDEAVLACAKRVKDYSVKRRLRSALQQSIALCEQSGIATEDLLCKIEDEVVNLKNLGHTSRSGPTHIKDMLGDFLGRLDAQMSGDVTPASTTGYPDLDNQIYGLTDEDFIILAGRPSMGKTACALNLMRHGAKSGRPQLGFSLEMTKQAWVRRIMSTETRVNLSSLRKAELTNYDFEQITEGLHQLEDTPIWIDDSPGLSMHEIRSRSREFVAKHGKCTIWVDYIQIVGQSESAIEQRNHVSMVSSALKGLARELQVPVVGLSQLNRTLEARANKRPVMSDLKDSGSLEQDADIIMFLYRDVVYNQNTQDPDVTEVIVAKQRDGAVGTVKLGFAGQTNTFYQL